MLEPVWAGRQALEPVYQPEQEDELAPMYLNAEARVKGLIRLLSIGLRVLTLVLLDEGTQMQTHLTALTPVQRRILELLDLPLEIYTRLTEHFSEPVLKLSEP